MHKSMFPSARETGSVVNVGARSGSPLSSSIVEGLAAKASRRGLPLVFDRGVTLSGDVLIDAPLQIIIRPGVTVTMADNPVWSHGVHLTDRSVYYAGMFTFRPGSEGTVLDWWGGLDGNEEQAGSVDGAPVAVGAVLAVGHGYDLPRPSLNFLGTPSFSNVAEAGILIRTSFWGPGGWVGAGFMAPSLPGTFHRVIDRDLTEPPADPVPRDAYIVAAGGAGAWAGWDNAVAYWWDGAWQRRDPVHAVGEYWTVIIEDEALRAMWDGTAWVDQFTLVDWDDPDLASQAED